MSTFSDGYNEQEIDAPKFVSRGEWNISGNVSSHAFMPLKAVTTLATGAFGVSGTYETYQYCLPYNDNSGITGCIGVLLRAIKHINDTGIGYSTNQNLGLRKVLVMHEGYCPMYYQSGLLSKVPQTMKYGDIIAPCISGFRTWEPLNKIAVSVAPAATGYTYGTGYEQVKLGWWADVTSNLTGVRYRVKIMPHHALGARK
jgi:hypothetical protein